MLKFLKRRKAKKTIEEDVSLEDQQPLTKIPEPEVISESVQLIPEAIPKLREKSKLESEPELKTEPVIESTHAIKTEAVEKKGLFKRLSSGLSKTRSSISSGIGNVLLGKKIIDTELLEELEDQLLIADVGVEATSKIMTELTGQVARKELADGDALLVALKKALVATLKPSEKPFEALSTQPYVILMIGVNGAGKTTTIGKLTKRLQAQGLKVMLAAGDTFRAAATEQLQVWGERNQIPVIAQHQGADSASVAFDALQSAKAREMDVLIIDTAGRLHTQSNLMQELEKVKRVLKKIDVDAPHETLLVLDAGNGQNALNQAKQFNEVMDVSGIVLTKLDGTAKGGIIFAINQQLQIPVRFIGVGEAIDDLQEFDSKVFVDALFENPA